MASGFAAYRSCNHAIPAIESKLEKAVPEVLDCDELMPTATARAVVDPHAYAEWDDWHATMQVLRRTQPFARGELDGYDRFWVASKYDDILAITRQPQVFLSGHTALETREQMEVDAARGANSSSVVLMNAPQHIKYRLLTQGWFQPKSIRTIEDRIRTLARGYIDRIRDEGGYCDFWNMISKRYSLRVIMSILGIPAEHEDLMLAMTTSDANDFVDVEPEQLAQVKLESMQKIWSYFSVLTEERRQKPEDDLGSVIANARINGEPMSELDTKGYYQTILIAGHETTSASLAGAIWALAERPGELAKVKADPSLIDSLVEECVRWTTPIYQFTRTAAHDTEHRGRKIRAGDRVVLSFLSANRDEDINEDPFSFRVDRTDCRHVGFSSGAHICLGMHLARMEMRVFFEELLPRLKSLELAGEPRRRLTNFVGGPEYLPVRFALD